ncbi:MAG: hypothetical protein JSR76_00400 [Verrucomicrobia bacterium]|nr:hypothetical protein [Verrucomicrobiota bacterium]
MGKTSNKQRFTKEIDSKSSLTRKIRFIMQQIKVQAALQETKTHKERLYQKPTGREKM